MTDSLPPLTIEDLVEILKNPNFKTYVVLGTAAGRAWKLALAAQNFAPGLRSYLVKPAAQEAARTWFKLASATVGMVFGRGKTVPAQLTRAQAEDFLTVMETIRDAP